MLRPYGLRPLLIVQRCVAFYSLRANLALLLLGDKQHNTPFRGCGGFATSPHSFHQALPNPHC